MRSQAHAADTPLGVEHHRRLQKPKPKRQRKKEEVLSGSDPPQHPCNMWIAQNSLPEQRQAHSPLGSVQTKWIVKGEAQTNPFSGNFLGGFDFLRSTCFLGIPQENL